MLRKKYVYMYHRYDNMFNLNTDTAVGDTYKMRSTFGKSFPVHAIETRKKITENKDHEIGTCKYHFSQKSGNWLNYALICINFQLQVRVKDVWAAANHKSYAIIFINDWDLFYKYHIAIC